MGKATIIEAQNSNTSYENSNRKGILGMLKGPFADYKNGTRNSDRLYTEELWDKRVFGSEDVMEALETKTLFGELDHPEGDRCETLAKNAAISITKLEKRPEEGIIWGEAEILDTPTGRIVKALADSGAKLGVSSRGMGEEVYQDGKNIIDPDTYDFITFDVVVTPANTKARVALTESKTINKLTESLKAEINESETVNQLNQLKSVISTVNNSEDLINLIEQKTRKLSKTKINDKLVEANKQIALDYFKKQLNNSQKELEESLKASKSLSNENNKLISEKEFYKSSRINLQTKLKESNSKVNELSNKLEEQKANNEQLKSKILKNTRLNDSKIKELSDKLLISESQNKQLSDKYNKLLENNKLLSKNLESNSKILEENANLKNRIEQLRKEKSSSMQKLQESESLKDKKIAELNSKIKILEAKNKEAIDAEERFKDLSFNPVGTFKALQENININEYDAEDQALYNVLTGRN